MQRRAIANANWVKSETLERIDRAILSKPMHPVYLERGMLVNICRETVITGGRLVSGKEPVSPSPPSGHTARWLPQFGAAGALPCARLTL